MIFIIVNTFINIIVKTNIYFLIFYLILLTAFMFKLLNKATPKLKCFFQSLISLLKILILSAHLYTNNFLLISYSQIEK
jgi:hypothetical protein